MTFSLLSSGLGRRMDARVTFKSQLRHHVEGDRDEEYGDAGGRQHPEDGPRTP